MRTETEYLSLMGILRENKPSPYVLLMVLM